MPPCSRCDVDDRIWTQPECTFVGVSHIFIAFERVHLPPAGMHKTRKYGCFRLAHLQPTFGSSMVIQVSRFKMLLLRLKWASTQCFLET